MATERRSYARMPEWKAWYNMRHRCLNPFCTSWEHYGGRGIRVCERWESFEAFYADMGPRPDGHSLDRIDNNGNYEPGNCRWATCSQQAKNQRHPRRSERRSQKMVTIDGRTRSIRAWCLEIGIVSVATAYQRVRRGWDPVDAMKSPPIDLRGLRNPYGECPHHRRTESGACAMCGEDRNV